MGFSQEIKERALVACKWHCVLCEKNKGINVECHHIISRASGGDDTFDNCIPLCFDCHSMVGSYNPKHPKGNRFFPEELKSRRDLFYKRVQNGEFPQNKSIVENKEDDRQAYLEIKEIFNSPNLEYYLTEMDLGNDFDNRIFDPLNQFMWMRNNPDYGFVDYEIEEYKNRLFLSVDAFLRYKAINTFPTSIGTQAIYTWKNDSYSFKDSLRINREFNDLATEVWKSYKAFVSICKRKLQ